VTILEDEINKFKNKGNISSNLTPKILQFFDSKSNSKTNSNTSSIDDLSDFRDLFYQSNKSNTSVNSLDSNETIKPSKQKNKIIKNPYN